MLVILEEQTTFLCKHISVVHVQTTRLQHRTISENGHLANSLPQLEFEWIRKGMHFQIDNPEWLFALDAAMI